MYAFDLKTSTEILAPKHKSSGTERVLTQLLSSKFKEIKNIQFGKTNCPVAIGKIDCKCFPEIIFNGCNFNQVKIANASNKIIFKNCDFKQVSFISCAEVKFENCTFNNLQVRLSGCEFVNSSGFCIYISKKLKTFNNTTIINCEGDFKELQKEIEDWEAKAREEEEKQRELRENLKYGYKIVQAPVLVKLSFPEDAKIVNLDRDKSRCDKAFVESVHILNSFGGEGVTNTEYSKLTEYKVGELVFPDAFDNSSFETCGHGIHFCKNIVDLTYFNFMHNEIAKTLKSYEEESEK